LISTSLWSWAIYEEPKNIVKIYYPGTTVITVLFRAKNIVESNSIAQRDEIKANGTDIYKVGVWKQRAKLRVASKACRVEMKKV
jgi:hypothetical protein